MGNVFEAFGETEEDKLYYQKLQEIHQEIQTSEFSFMNLLLFATITNEIPENDGLIKIANKMNTLLLKVNSILVNKIDTLQATSNESLTKNRKTLNRRVISLINVLENVIFCINNYRIQNNLKANKVEDDIDLSTITNYQYVSSKLSHQSNNNSKSENNVNGGIDNNSKAQLNKKAKLKSIHLKLFEFEQLVVKFCIRASSTNNTAKLIEIKNQLALLNGKIDTLQYNVDEIAGCSIENKKFRKQINNRINDLSNIVQKIFKALTSRLASYELD